MYIYSMSVIIKASRPITKNFIYTCQRLLSFYRGELFDQSLHPDVTRPQQVTNVASTSNRQI